MISNGITITVSLITTEEVPLATATREGSHCIDTELGTASIAFRTLINVYIHENMSLSNTIIISNQYCMNGHYFELIFVDIIQRIYIFFLKPKLNFMKRLCESPACLWTSTQTNLMHVQTHSKLTVFTERYEKAGGHGYN